MYVPKARTSVFKNSVAVNGAHIWNELDPIIRNSNCLSAFKTTYMHFFKLEYSDARFNEHLLNVLVYLFINAIYLVSYFIYLLLFLL